MNLKTTEDQCGEGEVSNRSIQLAPLAKKKTYRVRTREINLIPGHVLPTHLLR